MFLTNFQKLVFCFLFSPEFKLVHVFVSYKLFLIKHTACKYLKVILGCLLSIHSKKLLRSDMLTSLNSTLSWDKLCNHWCLWPNHLVTDIYSWIPFFVMIRVISTEHRALNHIPFIYLIFLASYLIPLPEIGLWFVRSPVWWLNCIRWNQNHQLDLAWRFSESASS